MLGYECIWNELEVGSANGNINTARFINDGALIYLMCKKKYKKNGLLGFIVSYLEVWIGYLYWGYIGIRMVRMKK